MSERIGTPGTPVNAVAASIVLVIGNQPSAGENIIIDGVTYTFVADGAEDSPGEISIGADEAAAKVNIVAAINGTDGHNDAHPTVSAADFSGDNCTISALTKGVAANAIAVSDTLAGSGDGFATGVLAGGVDGTIGARGVCRHDESYLYLSTADNDITGANWRRISLGSVF